ncbi:aminomethyl transferase, glycine cleavage T protein [Melioribacter roseus P3M-2]|uniref:Aminomethyl transferase, glycine cleavage T protein n=2 Tax=Melioribacteraceae TaxID=1334117 RepID=I6ZWQ7_MELRP|nr:aminomethyl transferase, glycine cleavage T protein [Melioribacter roseus P3M-2]
MFIETEKRKMPENIKEEYNLLRYGAGAVVLEENIIKLTGKDTLDFIHRVSTNDVKGLMPGAKIRTLFLNDKGRFVDRTIFLYITDFFWLVGQNDPDKKLLSWINKYIITEDIKTEDLTNDYKVITITGQQSASYLSLIFGQEFTSLDDKNLIVTQTSGFDTVLFRCVEKGQTFYKVIVKSNQYNQFVEYLNANKSVFDFGFVSDEAFKYYCILHGLPGRNEITLEFNPHEVGLTDEISFTKGCYIGQEVIARLDTYDKVQKKLIGVKIEANMPEKSYDIYNSGEFAGIITSGINVDGEFYGLAVVKKKYLDDNPLYISYEGKEVEIAVRNFD